MDCIFIVQQDTVYVAVFTGPHADALDHNVLATKYVSTVPLEQVIAEVQDVYPGVYVSMLPNCAVEQVNPMRYEVTPASARAGLGELLRRAASNRRHLAVLGTAPDMAWLRVNPLDVTLDYLIAAHHLAPLLARIP